MELEFTKTSKGHVATGDAGKYTLALNDNKLWVVKCGRELIGTVKGFGPAVAMAQEHEDNSSEPEPVVIKRGRGRPPKVSTDTSTAVKSSPGKPASAGVAIRRRGRPVGSKNRPVVGVASGKSVNHVKPTTSTNKRKPFPDFETWCADNVEPKKRGETADAYRRRMMGAKLKHGKQRKAYENGAANSTANTLLKGTEYTLLKGTEYYNNGTVVDTEVKRGRGRPPKVQTENTAPVQNEAPKRRGRPPGSTNKASRINDADRWNNWKEASAIEFEASRLVNALGSLKYAQAYGSQHPISESAKGNYIKAVERVHAAETKLQAVCNELGKPLPRGVTFMYLDKQLSDLSETDQNVLRGHPLFAPRRGRKPSK